MHWNANGLMERDVVGKVTRRRKITTVVAEEEKPDVVTISEVDKKRIEKLESLIIRYKNSLDQRDYWWILEEYVTLNIKGYLKICEAYKQFPFFDVRVDKQKTHHRNYLDCSISIRFYNSKEHLENNNYVDQVSVGLRELFGNCSSIVINRLSGSYIERDSSSYPPKPSKAGKFVNVYMKLLEKICSLVGYSSILYTSSDPETAEIVRDYLKENWKLLDTFKNKRNSHTIQYYKKAL